MEAAPNSNQAMSATLREVEKAWIQSSESEEFWFDNFPISKTLRRSKTIKGGLASLEFGRYMDMKGNWVDNDQVVWLGMITSDIPGNGAQLLKSITRACGRANLAVVGTPTPLKPKNWDPIRPFEFDVTRLVHWYMKQGFRLIQDGHQTRVVFVPTSGALTVDFSLF